MGEFYRQEFQAIRIQDEICLKVFKCADSFAPPKNMLLFHQFDEVSQVLFRKAHHPSDCPQVPKWSAQHCHVTNDLDAKPKVVFKLCVLGKQFCYSVCKQVHTHSPVCNWGISRLSFQMKNCTPIVVLRKAGDAPGHKPIVVFARQNTSSKGPFLACARGTLRFDMNNETKPKPWYWQYFVNMPENIL